MKIFFLIGKKQERKEDTVSVYFFCVKSVSTTAKIYLCY